MHSGFQALRSHLPMDIHGNFTGFNIPADAQQNIDRVLGAWQSAKETYGKKGDFLFGQFSLADIMYAPVVTRFRTYNVPVKERVCRNYMDAIWNHPPMQEWVTAAQEYQTA